MRIQLGILQQFLGKSQLDMSGEKERIGAIVLWLTATAVSLFV